MRIDTKQCVCLSRVSVAFLCSFSLPLGRNTCCQYALVRLLASTAIKSRMAPGFVQWMRRVMCGGLPPILTETNNDNQQLRNRLTKTRHLNDALRNFRQRARHEAAEEQRNRHEAAEEQRNRHQAANKQRAARMMHLRRECVRACGAIHDGAPNVSSTLGAAYVGAEVCRPVM